MSVRIDLCVLLSSTAIFALGALPTNAAPAKEAGRIEEIMVTAQKRVQSLQDVPIAVTSFGADELKARRIDNLEDIASRTPGFAIGAQGPHSPELAIRGIGSTDREAASDRSVVMFLDEVYIGRTGGSSIDLFDLERIEVLRGPQGTLFGKNVVGGLVNVITATPSDKTEAYARASYGNFDYLEAVGVVNQPLSDTLFARLAFSTKRRNGTSTNRFTGSTMDGFNKTSVRGKIKYVPSDDFSLLLTADYAKDKVDGISTKIGPTDAFGDSLGYVPDPDPYVVDSNSDGFLDRQIAGVSARAEWNTSIGTVTSLTSYRDVSFDMVRDSVGASVNGGPDGDLGFDATVLEDEKDRLFSQELRLTSDSGGKLNWIAGLYFMREHTTRDQIHQGYIKRAGGGARINRPLFAQDNTTTHYSVFGEATYALTERLNFSAGGRYLVDKKKWTLEITNTDPINTNSINPAVELFSTGNNDTWKAFTPKASINFSIDDNNMVYALVSRGFKSGGRGGNAGSLAQSQVRFEPEWAWNYEVGSKSTFLDERMQLNLAAFIMDFKDLQAREIIELVPGDPTTRAAIIFNAASAKTKGVEVEFTAIPVKGLTISGTYAYLYSNISDAINPAYLDTRLPKAPRNTYSIMGLYETQVSDSALLSLRADYRYQGVTYFDLGELPAGREPGYGVLDGRISLEMQNSGWEISVWGKNILDKQYRTHAQSCCGGTFAVGRISDPATYGVSIAWRLN